MLGGLTDGAEDNTREGVANCELKDTSEHQQKTTKEDRGPTISFIRSNNGIV